MTWVNITNRARQRGYVEFGLLIHGLPYIFTTGGNWDNPMTLAGIEGDLTVVPFLTIEGIEESLELDPKEWTLKAKDMEFRLVDGRGSGAVLSTAQHQLTNIFGRKIGGVTSTRLAVTLEVGEVGAMKVDSVASFASSGDLYRGLETIGYDAKDAGPTPDEFQTLTRAKYGSIAVQHVYSLDPGGVRPEGDIIPLVTDKPTSLHGRYVTLYIREVRPDGNFDSVAGVPEVRYLGRIMGNVECDGPHWRIPTENAWTTIDSKIPSRARGAQLREVAFSRDQVIDWSTDLGANSDTVTITQHRFSNTLELVTVVREAINDSLRVAGDDTTIKPQVRQADGLWNWSITDDAGAFEILRLQWTTGELQRALGFVDALGVSASGQENQIWTDTRPDVLTRPAEAGVFYSGLDNIDVGVTDATIYSAFSLVEPAAAEGAPSYDVRSYVAIGPMVCRLISADPGTNTITIQPYSDSWTLVDEERSVQLSGDLTPVEVREVVVLAGTWWACWKALVESTTVAQDFKGFIRSTTVDWDAIDRADSLGPQIGMYRTLVEPMSFRDMLIEDMAVRGLLPTIAEGKVSCIPLTAPGEVDTSFAVDGGVILADSLLKSTYSRERILNALIYKWRWNWETQEFEAPTVQVNDALSQQDNGIVNALELENHGLNWRSDDSSTEIFAVARRFLQLFGSDYAVIEVPVTIGAAIVVPGDVVTLTDDSVPDPDDGARGVSGLQCLVLGVEMKPYEAKGKLTVLVVSDGRRRSGFAPAARIASYTDQGAPAGTQRYKLLVDDGFYSDLNEATFFVASMKVVVHERDNAVPIADEAFTVTAAGNNGTAVFIDAAPSVPMQAVITAGNGLLKLNAYDTANQIDAAKRYLHVADEDDGLIGTSGDEGFSPS